MKRANLHRFEVLTVVNIMITVFWGLTLCCVVDRYQHFGRIGYVHLLSYRWYLSTRLHKCHIPQDSNLISPSDGKKLSVVVRVLILDMQKPPFTVCWREEHQFSYTAVRQGTKVYHVGSICMQ